MTDVKLLLLHKQYLKPFNCVQKKELGLILKCYQPNVYKSYLIYE